MKLHTSSAGSKLAVTNGFFSGRVYTSMLSPQCSNIFLIFGCRYSLISVLVSSGSSSLCCCTIFSQIPLKGEFRSRYLLTSEGINLRSCCTSDLSCSSSNSVLINLARSCFSTFPKNRCWSSSTSPSTISNCVNGY